MSTAVTSMPGAQPAGVQPGTSRPRLRLVGPDEQGPHELGPDGTGEGVCPLPPGLRLTRRGRVVVTLVVAVAVMTLAVALATSVDAAAPQIDHATTVSAGQTLSGVASAQLPGLPIEDAVARIQLANGLSTSQVHAGQSLLIPEMP